MRCTWISPRRRSTSTVLAIALVASSLSTGTTAAARAQVTPAGAPRAASADEARRLAETSAGIVRTARLAPGDKVVILGGPSSLPFMEELAIAAERGGAHAWLLVTPERLARFRSLEKPTEFLGGTPNALDSAMIRLSDLVISVSNPEQTLADQEMPADRRALVNASNEAWEAIDRASHRRILVVGLPQPADTIGTGVDFGSYARMTWAAIGADYDRIAAQGAAIKRRLEHAKRVHVTSPEGTDLTFTLGEVPIAVLAGLPAAGGGPTPAERSASLPGGQVFVAIDSSANGRIRASIDVCPHPDRTLAKVRDEAIDIRGAAVENVHAATEEACVKDYLGSNRLTAFFIGLNPAFVARETPGGLFANVASAGFVGLSFGGNSFFGGPVAGPGGWYVPLLRATVEADGHVIVRDGKLVDSAEP